VRCSLPKGALTVFRDRSGKSDGVPSQRL